MSNKTIKINKEFFIPTAGKSSRKASPGSSNTHLPKGATATNASKGLNSLKTELLKRVGNNRAQKHGKAILTNHKPIDTTKPSSVSSTSSASSPLNELDDSINYLAQLSKKNEIAQLNKTLKNVAASRSPTALASASTFVQMTLPDELQEVHFVNPDPLSQALSAASPSSSETTVVLPDPQYGCLKVGGTKPTFRTWNKTQKLSVQDLAANANSFSFDIPSATTVREQKLKDLQTKVRSIVSSPSSTGMPTLPLLSSSETTTDILSEPIVLDDSITAASAASAVAATATSLPAALELPTSSSSGESLTLMNNSAVDEAFANDLERNEKLAKELSTIDELKHTKENQLKQTTKQTKVRKHTVGKNVARRHVGVLMKDGATRKNVTAAFRALKNDTLQEVKTYLKERNIIKKGCLAPSNVLRQMYESARMAGDIKNTNKDSLLDTFLDSAVP